MKFLVQGLIRVYHYALSPLLGSRCRFFPSCSAYAAEAVEKYGVLKGLGLGLKRLSHCHPWHSGGFDPLP